jgi:hypothetical protein
MLPRLAWLALLLAPALAGCPNDVGFPGGTGPDGPGGSGGPDGSGGDGDERVPAEDPYWCCDPDEGACVCQSYWRCTDGFAGKTCRQANPTLPDGGGEGPWSCEYRDDSIVCTGSAEDHPDAGSHGEWVCAEDGAAGTVECSREATDEDYPDAGADVPWDCTYSPQSEIRACREPREETPDGGDWECWTAGDGRTTCVDRAPETPDDGEWDCLQVDGHDVCQGDHFPDEGEAVGWDCEQIAEMVRCENGEGQAPDDGEGIVWDCTWDQAALVCIDLPDGGGDGGVVQGSPDGGGDEGGGGEPDSPDGGGGEEVPCGCVADATRMCDEPAFCLFGEQTCVDLGGGETRWGACAEADIPGGCEPGGDFAADFWWEYRGGYWDNEEQQANDFDGDGRILMPPDWWFNPSGEDCAIRRGGCVQDMWDLDGDGDNQESIGTCDGIDECG